MSCSASLYSKTRTLLLPQLENSQVLYARVLRSALVGAGRWLDLGCGRSVVPEWLAHRVPLPDLKGCIAVGLDRDRRALARNHHLPLRVAGDAEDLPFADRTFDVITANMVLEHIEEPARLFGSVTRVLRPGGRFIVHTPNVEGYTTMLTRLVPRRLRPRLAHVLHGRPLDDVYRTYYRANGRAVLDRLASSAGLELRAIEFVQTSPQLIAFAPLMVGEMLVIRALSVARLSRFRACLLVDFRKPHS